MIPTKLPKLIFTLFILFFLITCDKEKEESQKTVSTTVETDQNGGTYELQNGIQLVVPEGAVTSSVTLTLEEMDYTSFSTSLPTLITEDEYITCFRGEPDGIEFEKPITLKYTGISLPTGFIPILKTYQEDEEKFLLPASELTYDPESGTLELSVSHFSSNVVQAVEQYNSDECKETPCRCGTIKVKQYDEHNTCSSGDCQVTESSVEVTFVDCDNLIEYSVFKEVDPNCTPKITLTPAAKTLTMGESTIVNANVELDCVPIEKQSVDFVSDKLGSFDPTSGISDENGNVITSFTAGIVTGTSTLQANSTVSFYAHTITAGGETYKGPLYTKSTSGTTEIEIIDSTEHWTGNFTATFDGCNEGFCCSDYIVSIDLDFTLSPSNWKEMVAFVYTEVTRTGEVANNSECNLLIENATGTFTDEILIVNLNEEERTGELLIWFYEELFTFTMVGELDECWSLPGSYGVDIIADIALESGFSFDLNKENYNNTGSCDLGASIGGTVAEGGTYEFTLTRETE